MSDPLRQELLDIFVGRATKRYGLSAITDLPQQDQGDVGTLGT